MKEVIRLTESDITRIVRRVIKEQSSEVIKVKAWSTADERTKLTPRGFNIDITDIKLKNNMVRFKLTIPGEGDQGSFGWTFCGGTGKNSIETALKRNGMKTQELYLTPVGYKKITKLCDSYVSNDTKTNGDYV